METRKRMSLMYRHPRIYETVLKLLHRDALDARYRLVSQMVEGESVFDIGCGTALFHEYVKEKRYLGWDLNPRFVKYARKKGVNVVEKDITDFHQYPEADTYVIFDVLHHVGNARDVVMHALEKSRKKVIVCEPFDKPLARRIIRLMQKARMYNSYMRVIGDYDGINKTWNNPWFDEDELQRFFRGLGSCTLYKVGNDIIAAFERN